MKLMFDGTQAERDAYRANVDRQLEVFENRPGEFWVRWNVGGVANSIPHTSAASRETAEQHRQAVIAGKLAEYDQICNG